LTLSDPAMVLQNIQFSYASKTPTIQMDQLTVARESRVFLHGPSGSGKTTLLGLMGGVLSPQKGSITILGQDLTNMSHSQRDQFRGAHIGYIFQMFNLIPYLTVAENIMLPCRMNQTRLNRVPGDLTNAARSLAAQLGLESHFDQNVTQLSVGQQQRVAAIRALLGSPEIVIADEPTSSLDSDLREEFIQLLFKLCDQSKATLVFVSHDQSLKPLFSQHLSLRDLNSAHKSKTKDLA
jgi:putative ABC transport system ATP-binding protein